MESRLMAPCDWQACSAPATHTVNISFPEGIQETWQVCRDHDRILKIQAVCGRPKAPTPADTPARHEVHCGACDRLLDEPASLPEAARQPCPACGSLDRKQVVLLFETATAHEALQLKAKPAGKGGWITSIRTGDDYTRCLEGWGTRELALDKAEDSYREVIVLHDGTRLESRARLSDHH